MAFVKRVARSAGGGGLGEAKGDCVAETGCDGGAGRCCWSADRRDWRLGPSRELIRLAILGGFESAGRPG